MAYSTNHGQNINENMTGKYFIVIVNSEFLIPVKGKHEYSQIISHIQNTKS